MTGETMIDYFVILLIAVILLLVAQIAALIRVRFLIKQLKITLNTLNNRFGILQQKSVYPKSLKKCRFCKFRNSFINNPTEKNSDTFIYRCALNEKQVDLDHSCKHFQPELFYLKSILSQNSPRKS